MEEPQEDGQTPPTQTGQMSALGQRRLPGLEAVGRSPHEPNDAGIVQKKKEQVEEEQKDLATEQMVLAVATTAQVGCAMDIVRSPLRPAPATLDQGITPMSSAARLQGEQGTAPKEDESPAPDVDSIKASQV